MFDYSHAASLLAGCVIASLWWSRRRRLVRALDAPRPLSCAASRLQGGFYIVTGGAQGVGEGIACELAAEGASGITIADINETKGLAVQQSIVAAGCKAVFVCADLAKPAECQRVIAEHEAAFHRVDGLVNCAASTARGHWDDTSAEFFDASAFFTASIPLTNRFLSRAVRRVTQEQPWCLCCCRRACCVAVMALNARAPLLGPRLCSINEQLSRGQKARSVVV